jgi:cytochrome P450
MQERVDAEESPSNKPLDLLSKFQEAGKKHPEIMTPSRVLTMAVSMAFAGSETTAISLSAVFYYLLKTPRCYIKLIEELDVADLEGRLGTHDVVPWAAAQKLVYLDACIKEAFRLHPAAGLPLERITPATGLNIAGEYIPGGTIVGCSAWIVHRRAEVFGRDANIYRPERWIENTEAKLKEMNGTMFQFGMGARTCIGKNISLLEIYKLVPSVLRKFQVKAPLPCPQWKLSC